MELSSSREYLLNGNTVFKPYLILSFLPVANSHVARMIVNVFCETGDGKMRALIKISFYEFLIKDYSFFRIKRFIFFLFISFNTHPIPIKVYIQFLVLSRIQQRKGIILLQFMRSRGTAHFIWVNTVFFISIHFLFPSFTSTYVYRTVTG